MKFIFLLIHIELAFPELFLFWSLEVLYRLLQKHLVAVSKVGVSSVNAKVTKFRQLCISKTINGYKCFVETEIFWIHRFRMI